MEAPASPPTSATATASATSKDALNAESPSVDSEQKTEQADAPKEVPPRRRRRRRGGKRRRRTPADGPERTDDTPQTSKGPTPVTGGTPRSALAVMGHLEPPHAERAMPEGPERKIAMFCDFENIALGVRDSPADRFDMNLVLKRLLEKGKIIVKKAYADWERFNEYKRPFHEAAIELIDIPQKHYSGKNSADIRMVVDAMDLCYSKDHLDTFVVVSGDSDFSPLVSKLKENDKNVIGIGVKNASSALLIDNCDEFIFYEDMWRDMQNVPRLDHLSPKEAELFALLADAILALTREGEEALWGSMIKQTMKRNRPSFNEGYYGYRSFTELLRDAERKNIIALDRDQRSGTDFVTGFAEQS